MRLFPILFVLAACGGKGDSASTSPTTGTASTATGPGTLVLSFGIEADVLAGMTETASGDFNGEIYRDEDASAVGPNDGATPVEDVTVTIDLTTGDAVDAYTTGDLDPGVYWILGCLDTDDNGCDTDDPITVPNENKFLVESGAASPARVFFSMLNPT